ncbi:amino acid transporter AVT1C-like [Hordeum vulgare subsp. vulgare]|uniref:amino acid transporter AVT1C-like n=1 Tax=Hordeum vulgare subsp. vulgare TaxID=112509 RepID=UPI001D1A5842|nr:amino acid transporter AVT1C-like [Hordeum vulgare subsp. vulgare]
MAAGGASAQLSTRLAFFLLLKRRPRIGDGFTRVNEVEESLDPTLDLVGVDSLARLDGVGYSISIIHLISGEYDIVFWSTSSCLKSNYIELPPPSSKCSSGQSVINGLNVLCRVGILTTCFGIKQAGWLSLLLLPLLGGCSCYTGLLLKRCIDSSPTIETYPDIGRAAFGIPGRVFVSVVLYLELYACCVEYITLLGDSLSSVFPSAHLAFTGIYLNSHNLFAISMALAILPSVWLRNLSLLSYLSAGGVVATLTVIVCLFWVDIGDGVGFHPSGSALNLTHLPVALGLYGYCFSGHLVFANIYSSMKERSQFPFVLLFCFIVVTIVYSGVVATGFLMFGESTMSQFTLNMPQQYVPSKIAIWMTIVNPYTKYALTMTLVALSIEEALPKKMQNYVAGMCVRTVLVLSTVVVALSFPYFALVMALLGSVFTMLAVRIRRAAGLPLDPEEDFEKEEVVKEEKEKEQELTEEALPLGVREKASTMEEGMDLWA